MKRMGFVASHKSGERRLALLPDDIKKIENKGQLYFEKGYGSFLNITDEEYEKCGCNVVSREEVLKCDIITDVKLGDADYFDKLSDNKILFGWAHAVQNIGFTTNAIKHGHTVIAWEEIFEHGRYILYRNREVAGEAAVLHALRYCGKMPYDCKIAILGNGMTAKGAMRILHGLGANIDVYGRKLEKLFKEKMFEYDIIVNCIMWDTSRTDHIIYEKDLKKFKQGTLIIDVSCDPHLGIESSHPTTIDDPVYEMDGVIHYAVDNTPAMFPFTISKDISLHISKYIDEVITEKFSESLNDATVIKNGKIVDERITNYRKNKGL